ncbi:MAG: DUF493 family protein [Bacteroidales bacterium]|jgi:hypothetical protein|nr:DUF493 family protein [Bacteroidales bacterium]
MSGEKMSAAEQASQLRARLEHEKWPQKYMFKFVLPNDRAKIDAALELLPTTSRTTFTNSRTGKYVSISCVANMASADAVMEVTSRVCQIEGVISL